MHGTFEKSCTKEIKKGGTYRNRYVPLAKML